MTFSEYKRTFPCWCKRCIWRIWVMWVGTKINPRQLSFLVRFHRRGKKRAKHIQDMIRKMSETGRYQP
jgi:hypothetical protein